MSAHNSGTTGRHPRDSWDFEGMRKKALNTLTESQRSNHKIVTKRPRTSDRSKSSVTALIPEEELRQFTVSDSLMRNRFLRRMASRRDLLMSVLSLCLLLASILLFAAIQVIQPAGYNRLIPDKFYTASFLQKNQLQQRCLQAFVVTLLSYLVTFNLSVRWKQEIDAEMELERLSREELIRFTS